jgi:NAD(P)H-hydrate epimerase
MPEKKVNYIVTSEEMKRCDHRVIHVLGVPSMVLMERAALAAVDELHGGGFDLSRVLCLCGAGNNGGDGFAAARLLAMEGVAAEALFVGDEAKLTDDTRQQMKIAGNYGVRIEKDFAAAAGMMASATTIVDALFGVGLARPLEGIYKEAVEACGRAAARILSIDVPSGISADTGAVMGAAVRATKTVVLAYQKAGLTREPGRSFAGEIAVRDIGVTDIGFGGVFPKAMA